MNPASEVRDGMIHQAQQERIVRDTLIMQKVNGAHRDAFLKRFPGQIEHCMRLTAERLQAILTRKPTDLADPTTWNCTAEEIRDLTVALDKLAHLHHAYPMETTNEPDKA
jgi:hypothetical protein